MDWDRVHEEDLVRRRGTVSIFADPKPIVTSPAIADLMRNPNFPHSALGRTVRTKSFVGKISEVLDGGARIKITNKAKLSKIFVVELLRNVEKETPKRSRKKKKKNRQPT